MEGGAYGAGKAGGAFDPYTLVRQPHTILRVVSWVRTQQGGLGRGAPGTGATSPGPGGPADPSGSWPLPPSSLAPSPRPPGCRCPASSDSVRVRPWRLSPSSRPFIGGRGSGRGSFSRAHCCTCRALSGRGLGTRFCCSPCTLRSSESGAWILGFRRDPHLLCRVTLGREPPQKRPGIRDIQFQAGWGASPLMSCLSFSIYRGGRSLLEAPALTFYESVTLSSPANT